MYKTLFAAMFLIVALTISLPAQQVVSSGGGSFFSPAATMTFTVGETVISTFTQPNGPSLTQGFNQAQLAPELQVQFESANLISGSELFFATVEPGASSTLVLTLRNAGNGPFSVSALNFNGDPVFSIEGALSFPIVLQAGAEQVLTVLFNPLEANDFTGVLSITNTDPNANPFTIDLRASAVIADLPVLPLPAVFLLSLSLLVLGIRSFNKL